MDPDLILGLSIIMIYQKLFRVQKVQAICGYVWCGSTGHLTTFKCPALLYRKYSHYFVLHSNYKFY